MTAFADRRSLVRKCPRPHSAEALAEEHALRSIADSGDRVVQLTAGLLQVMWLARPHVVDLHWQGLLSFLAQQGAIDKAVLTRFELFATFKLLLFFVRVLHS